MRIIIAFALIALAGCETPSQNVYDFRETGRSVLVDFGTILDIRDVKVKGPNTGLASTVGGVAGGAAGSNIGSGSGQVAGAVAGAAAGMVIGAMAEQALSDRPGVELTIVTEKGKVLTVVQYYKPEEPSLRKGQRVMLQTSGSYQRVLPADHLPYSVDRPKGINVVD